MLQKRSYLFIFFYCSILELSRLHTHFFLFALFSINKAHHGRNQLNFSWKRRPRTFFFLCFCLQTWYLSVFPFPQFLLIEPHQPTSLVLFDVFFSLVLKAGEKNWKDKFETNSSRFARVAVFLALAFLGGFDIVEARLILCFRKVRQQDGLTRSSLCAAMKFLLKQPWQGIFLPDCLVLPVYVLQIMSSVDAFGFDFQSLCQLFLGAHHWLKFLIWHWHWFL